MKKLLVLFSLTILFLGCKSQQTKNSEIDVLFNVMKGYYTSEKQSVADADYYNISLRMTPIWKDKGHYLFVEQAMATKPESPYRVRVYRLIKGENDTFVSEIYTIKNEKEWIGKWATPEFYDALPMDAIELKQGCEVVLKKTGVNKYQGQTGNQTCASELRGAKYASSIVTIESNKMISWDQGFDENGKQVWGAEKGGYIFEKQ